MGPDPEDIEATAAWLKAELTKRFDGKMPTPSEVKAALLAIVAVRRVS